MAAAEDQQPPHPLHPQPASGCLSRVDRVVLPWLGGFGRYQKQLIVLSWIPALFIGFSQFSDTFLLAQPGNSSCVEPSGAPGGTPGNTGTGTPFNGTGEACRCRRWKHTLECGLLQNVVTKWSLVCEDAWKVHITKFSLLVGSIFGYLIMGVLADWYGRHPVLLSSVLFMLVFGLSVAFSINVVMFSTLRFFEGFCMAGITLSLYVLRIELCLPGWRFSMTMVANFVILGGQLLMPGLAALCRDWQVLQAVIIGPFILMLSYTWVFPESLRWLLTTQQYGRAKLQIDQISKKNRVNTASEILTELQGALQLKPKKACIVKMVGTRNLWKNIVVLCVNSLTGYGIHHCFARSIMDPEANETSNFYEATMFHNFYKDYYTKAAIAVSSGMALCSAVYILGRRGGLLMFMIITALASLLQLGLPNLLGKYSTELKIDGSEKFNRNFSLAFSIIGMFSSQAASNLSIFICAEISPTAIRGGGLGLVLASAGFGMLTSPIMEWHNQKGYFLHHIIFACCTLICIICILLLPETRRQDLPEAIADGENYVSQPLLPPRRPGEQRRLLSRSASRVYDTPLRQFTGPSVPGPSDPIDPGLITPLTSDSTVFETPLHHAIATDAGGAVTVDITSPMSCLTDSTALPQTDPVGSRSSDSNGLVVKDSAASLPLAGTIISPTDSSLPLADSTVVLEMDCNPSATTALPNTIRASPSRPPLSNVTDPLLSTETADGSTNFGSSKAVALPPDNGNHLISLPQVSSIPHSPENAHSHSKADNIHPFPENTCVTNPDSDVSPPAELSIPLSTEDCLLSKTGPTDQPDVISPHSEYTNSPSLDVIGHSPKDSLDQSDSTNSHPADYTILCPTDSHVPASHDCPIPPATDSPLQSPAHSASSSAHSTIPLPLDLSCSLSNESTLVPQHDPNISCSAHSTPTLDTDSIPCTMLPIRPTTDCATATKDPHSRDSVIRPDHDSAAGVTLDSSEHAAKDTIPSCSTVIGATPS